MKVLLVSASPASRESLMAFLRSAIAELGERPVLETSVYEHVPDGHSAQPFDVVIVDVIEDHVVKVTMDKIKAWPSCPIILGYYVGDKQYIRDTLIALGAKECLTVKPNLSGSVMHHLPFLREQLQTSAMVDAA